VAITFWKIYSVLISAMLLSILKLPLDFPLYLLRITRKHLKLSHHNFQIRNHSNCESFFHAIAKSIMYPVKRVSLDNDHSLHYVQANCWAVSTLQTAWGFKSTVIEHGLLSLKPEQIHNGPEANDKERYDTRMRSSNLINWQQQTGKYTVLLLRCTRRP